MSPRYAARMELLAQSPPATGQPTLRFRAVVVMVVLFMVALLTVSVTGAVVGARHNKQAALDTFSYVGDITAERVARYANGARDIVESMVISLERDTGVRDRDDIAQELYTRLLREPEVRAIYVGYPDGSYVGVRRNGEGFVERIVTSAPESEMTDTYRDSFFRHLYSERVPEAYDPRTRPWYQAGIEASGSTWTDPYINVETQTTAASAVRSAWIEEDTYAVVGADLLMSSLSDVLDELPIGDGAQAYVLSPHREVVAAPTDMVPMLDRLVAETGQVPQASDMGIPEVGQLGPDHSEVFVQDGGRYLLERGFLPADGLTWVLHLEADESQLSPALARMQVTLAWVTGLSAVLVLLGGTLLYRLWQPLEQLRVRATTDMLTGLSNRHDLERRGARLLASAYRSHDPVVVVAMDLDDFKRLNDTYGHHIGDRALAIVGQTLLDNIRERDVAARVGGDEFVLLLRVRDGERAADVVERIRAAVTAQLAERVVGGATVGVTAGYTLTDVVSRDLHALLQEADGALVLGKRKEKQATYAWDRMDGRQPIA